MSIVIACKSAASRALILADDAARALARKAAPVKHPPFGRYRTSLEANEAICRSLERAASRIGGDSPSFWPSRENIMIAYSQNGFMSGAYLDDLLPYLPFVGPDDLLGLIQRTT